MRQLLGRAAVLHALALALVACGGTPAAVPAAPSATPAPLAATIAPSATPAPLAATIAPSATPAPLAAPRQGTAAALGITLIPATESALAAPVRPPATPAPASGVAGGSHIQQAIADLAARLGVNPGTITVLRAEEVDWPDGSLGCPRDDMSYTQAIVNGVFVQLEAGGQQYNYHGRTGAAPFLCTSKRAITPDDLPPELRGGGGEGT